MAKYRQKNENPPKILNNNHPFTMVGPIPLVGHVVPLMAMIESVASASSALEGFTVVSLDGGVRDPWAWMEEGRVRAVVNGSLGCQNWVVGTQLTGLPVLSLRLKENICPKLPKTIILVRHDGFLSETFFSSDSY